MGNGAVDRSFVARASGEPARRMATTAPCGIAPCCASQAAMSSREIWGPTFGRSVQIHHYQRGDQALRRNLARGPSPGNQRGGSNDAGSRLRGRGLWRRRGLPIGQVHHVRIAIRLRRTGAPVGEQQNGEYERIGDDETADPHSSPDGTRYDASSACIVARGGAKFNPRLYMTP